MLLLEMTGVFHVSTKSECGGGFLDMLQEGGYTQSGVILAPNGQVLDMCGAGNLKLSDGDTVHLLIPLAGG